MAEAADVLTQQRLLPERLVHLAFKPLDLRPQNVLLPGHFVELLLGLVRVRVGDVFQPRVNDVKNDGFVRDRGDVAGMKAADGPCCERHDGGIARLAVVHGVARRVRADIPVLETPQENGSLGVLFQHNKLVVSVNDVLCVRPIHANQAFHVGVSLEAYACN